jgi:3-methyladenine DNA glycosylase Mpg
MPTYKQRALGMRRSAWRRQALTGTSSTEAYIGEDRRHCRRPDQPQMCNPPGRAYVYFTYGMPGCSTSSPRGGAPGGPDHAIHPVKHRPDCLADGSLHLNDEWAGENCRAHNIDQQLNGADLCAGFSLSKLPAHFGFSVTNGPRWVKHSARTVEEYALAILGEESGGVGW